MTTGFWFSKPSHENQKTGWLLFGLLVATVVAAEEQPSITFNKNFEGGALGKIEKLGDAQFRC